MKKFKIIITGYGSEVTIGHLDEEIINFIKEKHYDGDSLESIIDDEDVIDTHWSQIDDVFHNFNANEDFQMEIIDITTNEVIYSITSEELRSNDDMLEYDDFEELFTPSIDEDLVVCCVTGEKGILFEGEFEDEFFDLNKLKVNIIMDVQIRDYYHGNMVNKILYNDELINNDGGSTDGKSFNVYLNL